MFQHKYGLANPEFDTLYPELAALVVTYNKTLSGYHVTNIEGEICMIKEWVRSDWSPLTFPNCKPEAITDWLVINMVMWLKYFPRTGGFSTAPITCAIIGGQTLQHSQNVLAEFGSYEQSYEDNLPINSTKERTRRAIWLGATFNAQETYIFYSLRTGKIVTRTHWALLSMATEGMQQVIEMVMEQKSNLGLHFGNRRKGILDQIDPGAVKITCVSYEELQ